MRILIYERDHTGHRMMGVRMLMDALLELADRQRVPLQITLATTAAALASPELIERLGPVQGRYRPQIVPPEAAGVEPDSAARQAVAKRRDLLMLVESGDFDHIYIPYGDGLLQMLAVEQIARGFRRRWPQGVEAEAIMMRTAFAYQDVRPSRRWLGRFTLQHAPVDRIHLIDPAACDRLLQDMPRLAGRVRVMPDPVSKMPARDRAQARQVLGLPQSARVVASLGYLDDRKGVDLLMAAFARASQAADDRLLLAGHHTPTVLAQVQAAQAKDPRIVSLPRYLSETEFADALAAIDLMATPYRNFTGSASLVIHAAGAGKPSIGNDLGWMGAIIPRFGLGHVCDVGDADGFARCLADAIEAAPGFRLGPAATHFLDYNRTGNIRAHWTARLRERLGLPAADGFVAWPR